ncbi:MAG: class I SAM-dependent methyltransferase, partial [Bacteroidales bacterium]|nr:class I SAM-dependent methyltransferase [Bacteroidales bacterium]
MLKDMFQNYPKKRPKLPKEYIEIYSSYHKGNREGKGIASFLSQKIESWMHRKVAKDVKKNSNKSTLEIGAGTLNQLKFEKAYYYEIVEPFKDLY